MRSMPPLNALRCFEAAARHLSLTRAAVELHVSPGAVSHQIRALEAKLGVALFERQVRAISLTPAGRRLYPGVQRGLLALRDAVASLGTSVDQRVLTVSTPPGLTSKFLAPRLSRFAAAHPAVETRISSSPDFVNFATDGVDLAVRNLTSDTRREPALLVEKLIDVWFVPVCSPRLIGRRPPRTPGALARLPLIHDDTLVRHAQVPTWADWFRAAGEPSADVSRGLRFNSADHALEAACEGAGVLLAHDLLAYDDLRNGRLVIPLPRPLHSGRAYFLVCPRRRRDAPQVRAFADWLREELAALDWTGIRGSS